MRSTTPTVVPSQRTLEEDSMAALALSEFLTSRASVRARFYHASPEGPSAITQP